MCMLSSVNLMKFCALVIYGLICGLWYKLSSTSKWYPKAFPSSINILCILGLKAEWISTLHLRHVADLKSSIIDYICASKEIHENIYNWKCGASGKGISDKQVKLYAGHKRPKFWTRPNFQNSSAIYFN